MSADNTAKRQAKLRTGTIETVFESDASSEELFGFGERINPKRSFVFVSRVLGRHIPVTPKTMRRSFTELARQLPLDLPGPVLMTSMAETAVGLGAGVHDAYLRLSDRSDVLNLSSTRAKRSTEQFARFSEDHSHASGHTLYLPAKQEDKELLRASRTLVMIDDETSSGNTMKSLGQALYNAGLTQIQRVVALTLTDWSSNDILVPSEAAHSGFVLAERFALLNGTYQWRALADAPVQSLPDADTPSVLAKEPLHRTGDARVGNSSHTPLALPPALLERSSAWHSDKRPVLVLGTGEHVWEPFMIAEALEHTGLNVQFSSTTRSPIMIGHDISCSYTFKDHEALGIRNYLYNVDPAEFASIIVCLDTSLDLVDSSLIKALRANIVYHDQFVDYASTLANRSDIQAVTLSRSQTETS